MSSHDFILERRLRKLDPELAALYNGCSTLFEQMLKKFLAVFPKFTDHTLLHSLNVINISNQLLRDEANKLNADEIYVYLMATSLHDIGMGVSDKDFELFVDAIGAREFLEQNPDLPKPVIIRRFHHEFSSEFVKKYWHILEIPNERYAHAIATVAMGHRKADLFDPALYPTEYTLSEGRGVNLAMLGALIRISDELDIATDRNPDLLYNPDTMQKMSDNEMLEFKKHKAIHTVIFSDDVIEVYADTDKPDVKAGVIEVIRDLKDTFKYSLRVFKERSDIKMSFTKVRFFLNGDEIEI